MIENVNCLVNVIAASSALAAVFISLYLYWAAQRPDVTPIFLMIGTTDASFLKSKT